MRKHLYLVTEHENGNIEGAVKETDTQLSRPLKNEKAPIHVLDEDEEGFRVVGKQVGLGYVDYEDEAEYEAQIGDDIKAKLAEIDEEHLHDAGLDPDEVLADV